MFPLSGNAFYLCHRSYASYVALRMSSPIAAWNISGFRWKNTGLFREYFCFMWVECQPFRTYVIMFNVCCARTHVRRRQSVELSSCTEYARRSPFFNTTCCFSYASVILQYDSGVVHKSKIIIFVPDINGEPAFQHKIILSSTHLNKAIRAHQICFTLIISSIWYRYSEMSRYRLQLPKTPVSLYNTTTV